MEHFNSIYDHKFLTRLEKKGNEKGVAFVLTHPAAELFRRALNKYLDIAFRHGIVDETLKKRLRSDLWETFYQVFAELKTGYFLEEVLKHKIEFYPSGRGMKKGDIAILTLYQKIFVEVKAPWEEPCLSGARVFDNANRIEQQLKEAYSKIPEDLPSMVVIAGWFNISLTLKNVGGIEKALYGRPVIIVPIARIGGPVDTSGRIRDGFFQPNQNRKLSAVCVLEDKFPQKEEYIFHVYHNPHAHLRIAPDIFREYPQYTFDHKQREIRSIRKWGQSPFW